MRKLLLLFLMAILGLSASGQKTLSQDYIIAKDSLRIGNRAVRQIVTVINSISTHYQLPTAKAVYDFFQANDDWGSQVVLTTDRFTGNGTDVSPLELAQQGAASGQVLKWNGSAWAPANDVGGGSGDNWGSQVVEHGATLTGNGTSGSPLDVATGGVGSTHVADNSLTAADLSVNVVSSVDGVTNDGGDIDLVAGSGITITPNDAANIITIVNAGDNDNSATNEVLTISDGTDSEPMGGQTLTVAGGGIVSADYVPATNTLTISASADGDGSATNEGILGVSAGLSTTSVITSNTSGANGVTISAATGLSISESTSSNGGTITLTPTDPSLSNEGSLTVNAGTSTTSVISSNTTGSTDVTLSAGTGLSISESGNTITLTNAGDNDNSTTNEVLTISDGTDSEALGGQTLTVAGSGIVSADYVPATNTLTISASADGDGSATNEGILGVSAGASTTSVITSNTSGANGVTITAATGLSISESTSSNGGTITLTPTDPSLSNEGSLTVNAGTSTTSVISSNTTGSTDVTLSAGSGIGISESGNTITISATGGGAANYQLLRDDGIDKTARNATNFVDGAYILFTLTDDAANGETEVAGGIVANSLGTGQIATDGVDAAEIATGAVGTSEVADNSLTAGDLSVNVVSSVDGVTNDGGDIDLVAGSGITITPNDAANTITITNAGDNDNSTTNEVLTISDGTDSEAMGGQTLTVASGGIVTADYVPATNTLTISASADGDGSATNEGILGVSAGLSTTSVITSNTSGANGVTISAATGLSISESTSSNGGTITLTPTDPSLSNEGSLTVNAGTSTTSVISSNTTGSTDVTLSAGTGLSISESGNTITLTNAGDNDNSTTNEVLTISDGTDSEALGGQTLTVAGSGIVSADYVPATNTLTISASADGDGSATNEGILGVSAGTSTTSVITSNTSGASGVTISAATGLSISESTSSNGGTITLTPTDPSLSNEGSLTVNAGTSTTSVISSNTTGSTDVTLSAGSGIGISESGNTITITASGGGNNYQTVRDDNTNMTQRAALNFTSGSSIDMILTDDAANGETEVFAGVKADGITGVEIAANAVGNTEMADNAVGPAELQNTTVTAATYAYPTSVTFDADGRATAATAGSAPAPADAQYVVLATNGTLSNERILTEGTNVNITDAGANAPVTINVLTEACVLGAAITPPIITADQNDYNPSSGTSGTTWRLSSDNNFRAITGISGGISNRLLILKNVGTNPILLRHNNSSSGPLNKFDFGTYRDIILFPGGEPVILGYDAAKVSWGLWNAPSDHDHPNAQRIDCFFTSATAADLDYYNFATTGGTVTIQNGTSGRPGNVSLSTSTASTNSVRMHGKGSGWFNKSKTYTRATFMIRIPTTSTSSERFTTRIGFGASNGTGDLPNGIYFRQADNVNSGNWQLVARSSNVETVTNTSTAPAANTWVLLEVIVPPSGGVEYWINGTLVGVTSTNIPTAAMAPCIHIEKSVGSGARTVEVESIRFYHVFN